MMEAVRSLGMAARFVSGYLYLPKRADRGGAAGRGGGATHAWLQVYLPGAGWVEFDPTNGIVGNRDLIRVAVVRDPQQAVPLAGSWIGFPADNLGHDRGGLGERRPRERRCAGGRTRTSDAARTVP